MLGGNRQETYRSEVAELALEGRDVSQRLQISVIVSLHRAALFTILGAHGEEDVGVESKRRASVDQMVMAVDKRRLKRKGKVAYLYS